MEAYTSLAMEYEKYMEHVPYDRWKDFIIAHLSANNITEGTVAEIACGTGSMSRLIASAGYDVIASDISAEMLSQAMESPHENIIYIQQDMQELELGQPADAIICVCNGMNYIMDNESLARVFTCVYDNLRDGGVFIFDMNSVYKFANVMANNDVYDNRDDGTFIWENFFDESTGDNQIDLTFYIRGADGRYDRYEETHFQHAFELGDVADILYEAGFDEVRAYDDYSEADPEETTEYYTFIAKRRE